ncbi:hypothetical protein EJ377_00430 [Chryseobacterium arthrosphaerae]|uniref:Uncharacterized protein n=1 Tax=Chryseobacterium arthrosphaerae TaxID=651561 RepID=A0A3S0PRM1_9FLAO|nr:hypothetical protein EJ377_00430 [Chryseobacterium arthrosphaerae]
MIPFSGVLAETKTVAEKNREDLSGVKRIKLGELDLFILTTVTFTKRSEFICSRATVSELKKF